MTERTKQRLGILMALIFIPLVLGGVLGGIYKVASYSQVEEYALGKPSTPTAIPSPTYGVLTLNHRPLVSITTQIIPLGGIVKSLCIQGYTHTIGGALDEPMSTDAWTTGDELSIHSIPLKPLCGAQWRYGVKK